MTVSEWLKRYGVSAVISAAFFYAGVYTGYQYHARNFDPFAGPVVHMDYCFNTTTGTWDRCPNHPDYGKDTMTLPPATYSGGGTQCPQRPSAPILLTPGSDLQTGSLWVTCVEK